MQEGISIYGAYEEEFSFQIEAEIITRRGSFQVARQLSNLFTYSTQAHHISVCLSVCVFIFTPIVREIHFLLPVIIHLAPIIHSHLHSKHLHRAGLISTGPQLNH